MNIRITPGHLAGSVTVPASKSHCHRLLIGAALASNMEAVPLDTHHSEDIQATCMALQSLQDPVPCIDCRESGSTLRFLLPVTMALKARASFYGSGRLPERPLSPLWEEMETHGCHLQHGDGSLICRAEGPLHGGDFFLPGDVSSQYVTGLLLALPLTQEGGTLHLTSPLQSAGYIDMTLQVLQQCSITIHSIADGYRIPGGQTYRVPDHPVPERDWSAAAFWIAANGLGADITCPGLSSVSTQRDREITTLTREIRNGQGIVDAEQIPDLVPVLSVLMAATPGLHRITGAARLRIKESDRLHAMAENLNTIGGDVTETEDGLLIHGKAQLQGGTTDGYNDHRIVMSMAIAATVCAQPVIIRGAQAAGKSYPDFFRDYRTLGGTADEIQLW